MNINENHISLLARAFEKDPMFVYLNLSIKENDQSKKLIGFIIKRNRLLDGLILTDHADEPTYVAIIDRPKNLRRVSILALMRLQVLMFMLIFQLPFHVLRFLTKYQKSSFLSAPPGPHYYLTMMGVDPSFQGKGIGKKVLGEIHDIIESGNPPYPIALDTENQKNVSFYEGSGYELKDTWIIDGLSVYCMTRSINNPTYSKSKLNGMKNV